MTKIEPRCSALLQVSSVHSIYYEELGNPIGTPVLYIHGGPGGGSGTHNRDRFDLNQYRTIFFDQRGAGRSIPYGSISENSTPHLIDDIESLRKELGIEKWILFGGSWGSTLALAYATRHPQRVIGMVLRGIFLGRKKELNWLYGPVGAATVFPKEYKRFIEHLKPSERKNPVSAYYRLLTNGDEVTQRQAADAWNRWETAISQLIPDENPVPKSDSGIAIARIECHYFKHACFFPSESYLLEKASKLVKIPVEIVQGRYDMVCPPETAFDLHSALPNSTLSMIPNAGHSSSEPGIRSEMAKALNRIASTL